MLFCNLSPMLLPMKQWLNILTLHFSTRSNIILWCSAHRLCCNHICATSDLLCFFPSWWLAPPFPHILRPETWAVSCPLSPTPGSLIPHTACSPHLKMFCIYYQLKVSPLLPVAVSMPFRYSSICGFEHPTAMASRFWSHGFRTETTVAWLVVADVTPKALVLRLWDPSAVTKIHFCPSISVVVLVTQYAGVAGSCIRFTFHFTGFGRSLCSFTDLPLAQSVLLPLRCHPCPNANLITINPTATHTAHPMQKEWQYCLCNVSIVQVICIYFWLSSFLSYPHLQDGSCLLVDTVMKPTGVGSMWSTNPSCVPHSSFVKIGSIQPAHRGSSHSCLSGKGGDVETQERALWKQ